MTAIRGLMFTLAAAAALAMPAWADDPVALRHEFVTSTDGVPLAVTECGAPDAPSVLLIHGFGQSYLSFRQQFTPALCGRFHLVAFDLRGHGGSGKPWEPVAYGSRERWADDVRSVMVARQLNRPLLVGWSFGGNVAVHYLVTHGVDKVRGLVLVGSGGGLETPAPRRGSVSPELFAKFGRAAATPDIPGQIEAAQWSQGLLTARPLPALETSQLVQASLMLPAYARAAMRGMPVSNAGLEGKLTLPVRFLVGVDDLAQDVEGLKALAARMPSASVLVFTESGHSPFLEQPESFNRELAAIAGSP